MSEQRNKLGKRYSSIFINPGEIREAFRKSTQQQYDQILKALSTNYFTKVATGSRLTKLSGGKNYLPVQSVGNRTPEHCVPQKVQKYLDQGVFDEAKEINKIMKLGQVFEDTKIVKNLKYSHENMKETQIKRRKVSAFKLKPENICGISSQKRVEKVPQKKQRPKTSKINKYERVSRNRSQEKLPLKFVIIDKYQPTAQIRKLKKTVQSLENIAIDQFGIMSLRHKAIEKEVDIFSDFDENINPKMFELETKLKQIRSSEKQNIESENCSVPISFLRAVGVKKSSTSRSQFYKRNPPRFYLRV